MAKRGSSSFGLGTLVGAVTGLVAGAVGVFLSDEDNRKKVVREARKVERVVEKDLKVARTKVRKAVKKTATKTTRKTTKRATKKRK